MNHARLLAFALCLGSLPACSLEPVKSGGACMRSTQCEPGLGCVQSKCSKDLSAIAATNTVPMLGGGTGGAGGAAGQAGGASGDASAGQGGQ